VGEIQLTIFVGTDAALYKQIQKGAYCCNGACVAYYIGRNETYSAIGHEGMASVLQQAFCISPSSWLDEGCRNSFFEQALQGQ